MHQGYRNFALKQDKRDCLLTILLISAHISMHLSKEMEYSIGKYGMLRRAYLKEYRKEMYLKLVLAGKLNEYLYQIDEECHQMLDRRVEQMKEHTVAFLEGISYNENSLIMHKIYRFGRKMTGLVDEWVKSGKSAM